MIHEHAPPLRTGQEDTRLRLLTAARELFAQRGSRGTTTREIAERAGVNEATLFRHFGTKHQLLDEMREHFAGLATLAPVMEGLTGPLEFDLRASASAMLQRLRANARPDSCSRWPRS